MSDEELDPVVSLHMSTLTLDSEAAQLLEIEWHPTRPLLATADVQGEVVLHKVARPTPRIKRVGSGGIAGKARALPPPPAMGGHAVQARFDHHQQSCRALAFHPDGAYAYTGSADKSIGIIDMATLRLSSQLHDAHDTGINRVCFYDENMLVSGDDDGFVHVWDLRVHNMAANAAAASASTARAAASKPHGSALYPLLRYQDAGDYISDILPVPSKNRMVITSGDGHLYVYDMRAGHIHEKVAIAHGRKAQPKPKPLGKSKAAQSKKLTPSGHMAPGGQATDTWFAMSDDVADELSGAVLLKRGRKLVCAGREEGVLNVFKWDYFGVAEDHFSLGVAGNDSEGSGASIDSIIKVDEDTVLTGSTDGLIRLVQLHPNKLLSILGTHDDFPIECMRMSPEVRGYFAGANVPDTPAPAPSAERDDDDDEDGSDDPDDDGPSSSHIAAPKDADTDSAFEAALSSLAPGYPGLLPRFLASSSHDGKVKFWNCSELYEVDPDEVREEESESDSDAGDSDDDEEGDKKATGKAKADRSAKTKAAKEEESDEDGDDDDGDEKAAEAEAEASMAQKQKAAISSKRKQRASPDSDDEDEDDEEEEGEDAEAEAEEGEDADSDSGAGENSPSDSEASGDEGKSDEEEAALAKPASLSLFARLAPTAASASAATAAAAAPAAPAPAAAAAAAPNMWMLVAPTTSTAAPARGKKSASAGSDSDVSGSDSDSEPSAKRRRKDGQDLNAGTGFFANLPASHPMHPSQQHKRAAKAPLKLEVDNIAHRPAKKRAALQEKLRQRAEKKARLEERKAAATANGEDPDLLELSSDEEQGGGGGGKKRKLNAGGARRAADSDDSDDSDADSDDSDAKPKKEPKERKMTAKEKKAAKKLERKKNPFFSGL